jgi:Na+-transporting NADH:ubiquinone oxidoreductase subunit NqrC
MAKHHEHPTHKYLIIGALVVILICAAYLGVAYYQGMWPFDQDDLQVYKRSSGGGAEEVEKKTVGGGALKQQVVDITHSRVPARPTHIDTNAATEENPQRKDMFMRQLQSTESSVGHPENARQVFRNKSKDALTAHFYGGNASIRDVLSNITDECTGIAPAPSHEDNSGDLRGYQELMAYN